MTTQAHLLRAELRDLDPAFLVQGRCPRPRRLLGVAGREFGRGDDVLALFELDPSPVMAGAEGGMS